ncbi:ricin-type beta-trefoil lectin domain protein [Actinocrinis sp.]|uniref:ricin-type beta-trefoil lectin domain protein n=1 Tax=Actinocrinis sp. TaxID=1920516 RepID=UPI002D3FE8F2|nr:ricin-type beta-trefoil lectin domain protein [Actinocrinis sp.]HZP51241.1 ricin-type beta-trefoil lectin domain protein [Actinocrinis sp.]
MRLTRTKATLTALPLVAAGGLLLALNGSAQAAGPAFPAHYAAPYLQVTTGDVGDMTADMSATGLKYYTLAFLIPQSGCTPQWEDGGYGLTAFNAQISSLQAAGGQVIISSGGAEGGELAQTCTSVSSLTAAYANIVNSTGVTRLDFDIEGGTLSDTASTTRRDQALAALQRQNPAVQVDFTLGVAPSGLPTGNASEYALLQDAKTQGVSVNIVNIMTMDFYDGQPVLSDAESAARNTANQLAGLYGISTAAAYAKMGLTPIAGTNDDGASFSQSDAQSLESFAAGNGVAELAFWEVDGYDKGTGYAYSRIFNQITGGTTPPPPPPGSGPITGYQGMCLDVRAAGTADGTAVQVYACNGTNAQQWTQTSGNQLQALGKCLDVSGAGTADGTKVQLWTCNGTVAQVWQHQSNGEYVNPNSGKCLDDTGWGGSGTQVQIWTCADSANQQWSLP